MKNLFSLESALLFTPTVLFALIAGFFYAFSVCVMLGLNRIAALEAIHAMQAINESVRNPVFFVTFFLTPVAALIGAALLAWLGYKASAIAMALAAIVYLAGAFLPTVSINVPMNEALAAIDTADLGETASGIWQDYTSRWTFWNTVRTAFSTISVLLASMAVALMPR